jgi:hypothetical protein
MEVMPRSGNHWKNEPPAKKTSSATPITKLGIA